MRIVHAIRSDAFAGVERHVAVLAGAQAEMGHSVVVIGGDPQVMDVELADSLVDVFPAASTGEVVHRLVGQRGADIVHAHMTAAEAAAAVVGPARWGGLVVTRHFPGVRGRSLAGRAVAPFIRRAVKAQIAISQYVAERVDGDSTVIYPGVHRPETVRVAGERQPMVLVAQRLEPEKRTEDAIRAFAAAGRNGWFLRVAGDGSLRGMLQNLTVDLGIAERVEFVGRTGAVRQLMAEASIMVAPCDVEGLGLSVIEAMAAGLPVVASRGGGHTETVGTAAPQLLYQPRDWRQASTVLARLMDSAHQRDEAGRQLRAVQGEYFSVEQQVAATDRVYRRILA